MFLVHAWVIPHALVHYCDKCAVCNCHTKLELPVPFIGVLAILMSSLGLQCHSFIRHHQFMYYYEVEY